MGIVRLFFQCYYQKQNYTEVTQNILANEWDTMDAVTKASSLDWINQAFDGLFFPQVATQNSIMQNVPPLNETTKQSKMSHNSIHWNDSFPLIWSSEVGCNKSPPLMIHLSEVTTKN